MRCTFLAPFCLIVFLSGCAAHQQLHNRPALVTRHVATEAGPTAAQQHLIADLCFKGMPIKQAENLGPTEFIYRDGYVLEYSSVDKIPYWVCEHIQKDHFKSGAERGNFKEDPDLHGPKATQTDYVHSGYDKGHQAPAGDQGAMPDLESQTFYMANMAPQFPKFNEQAWKSLEILLRTWVTKKYSAAYAFTGPIFYDPKEDNPSTADGTIPYITIGADAVAVPTHFYKIIIAKDPDTGDWKSIAFVMPNKKDYKSPYNLEQYIQSVEWIEEHTGVNFMPDLNATQRTQLEHNKSPMWQ